MSNQLKGFARLYKSASASPLAILRKKTGFPLKKCREALSENGEKLEIAEKWLYQRAQAEGWSKVESLKGRVANQGLVGLLIKDNKAAMVEVSLFAVDVVTDVLSLIHYDAVCIH